ncbi:YfzA family protein [Oceanobacillus halophilus]|uniref:YfzA-like protein n=1 Tax=Oceanobacillus halophilus TaxID=930130 RepID=A0A494ZWG9_9BACI|nr:YfzA family protein [Oceanobacillus halophilus]RKQ30400.1 hypothetical protein D8M06_15960 [Oceanobacillus halophilus]
MSRAEENPKLVKRWILILVILSVFQLFFIIADGTILEPNINDSNHLFSRMGRRILNSGLFTEWITPYSYPFFNMFTVIQIVAILFQAVQDIISPRKILNK